ncbi:MAG: ATP-binding protein [Planctomycetes bacterium]|nr:ATP-binding protein [Planctomycetota bacterium]
MTLPSEVLTRAHLRAPKGILYGPPGIGKTTFGAGADNPLIVDCENGAAHVTCDRTPYLSNWPAIRQWLDALAGGGHGYGTVVIDSVDWLLRRLEEFVSGVKDSDHGMSQTMNRSHGGYGNGKQVLKNYVYQYLLPTLDRIVNSGVAVVLLAHATRHEVTSIDGATAEKSAPDIHPDLVHVMIEWSDFVAAARKDANNVREMVLNETGQQLAKNRYGIDTALPMNWGALYAEIVRSQPTTSATETPTTGANNNA